MAVAAQPGGHGAVEVVDAELHPADEVVDLADPEQMARALVRQPRGRPPHDLVDLVLLAAQRAADGDPVAAARHDRVGRLGAQVLVHAALHDAVDELALGPVRRVPVQAAAQPAVRALRRARGVLAIDVEGRALVEDQRDVRAQRGLDLHARLGGHEAHRAVEAGAEPHALLLDGEDRAVALAAAAPLDLVGDAAVAHREDLEPARVSDDGAVPAHELVQPAELGDQLVAGVEEQVERVGEDHVVAQLGDLARLEALHGRLGRQRDEGRRAHLAVGRGERPGAGARAGVARVDAEGQAHGLRW